VETVEGEAMSTTNVQHMVEDVVLEIYERHIPFFPREPKPGFDLLIGAWRRDGMPDGRLSLIKTSDTAVSRPQAFECVGTGGALGNYLADSLHGGVQTLSLREGVFLAIYILRLAKKYAPGVGGRSSIVKLTGDGDIEPVWGVEDIEAAFEMVEPLVRPLLFAAVDKSMSDEDFSKRLKTVTEALENLRSGFPRPQF